MRLPLLSRLLPQPSESGTHRVYPRKGGGGCGKGGGKCGSAKSGASTSVPISGKSPVAGGTISTYNHGGGPETTIPSGQPFAGRKAGGGSRDDVYGSSVYGSGYPSSYSYPYPYYGTFDLGFPYYFWPVAWPVYGYTPPYLYNPELGGPYNKDRPGGVMVLSTFKSNSSDGKVNNTTFHLFADNSTVSALIDILRDNCTSNASGPDVYNASDPFSPRPEQAVQYYRASSVVLTLEGYNNTNALNNATGIDVSIPAWVDPFLLSCLNSTIGLAVPLFDSAAVSVPVPNTWSLVPFLAVVVYWFM
ncbi:hypothetical protein K474DRAFT_1670014 [Panus rudis PR-1116 ss-1]|nr:hypothetical protein K474DRAFT_1670014 [Panus rudis PR-1116 ss-1]